MALMENSLITDEKPVKTSVGSRIKFFFKETFRPHSKEEYAEVFTRGLGANCSEEVARKLPWLYIRVFALNLVLFAITAITFRVARYSADYLTAILFGGLLFNIPLCILFFELYPKRDLSLLKLFAVLVIGGVVSTILITLGYEFIYSTDSEPNAWISTLWVGFWEEFIKGAVAIAAIALLKRKDPLLCFLIGSAVGTGYSFTEDLGYIYSLSRSDGVSWLVLTSVGRGLSCVCSRAPWTAMIAWAYSKFKKPFINFRFYGIAVAMMALHYFADVPFFDDNLNILRSVTVGWAIEAAVVAAIFVAVFFVLKGYFKELYTEEKPALFQPAALDKRARLSQAANVTAVLCAALLSVLACVGCCVSVGNKLVYDKIFSDSEFIAFVQCNLSFNYNLKREYDAGQVDYSQFKSDGVLRGATQKVVDDESGYEYFYVYKFENKDKIPVLQSVGVRLEKLYYLRQMVVFEDHYYTYYGYPPEYPPVDESLWNENDGNEDDGNGDGEEPEETPKPLKVINFFNILDANCGYSMEGGCFEINNGKTEFVGLGAIIALSALAGATLIGGSAAFITLKIKARREENV